jgi:hypothetical protein
MANEVGTASNMEDLFGKIITFLTTNATLVGTGQAWIPLYVKRDNLLASTTNMVEPTLDTDRKTYHTYRNDPRTLNTDNETTSKLAAFKATCVLNTSFVSMQLRVAKSVLTVRVRAPQSTTDLSTMLRNFKLQYSDNGTTWTDALSVTTAAVFTAGEWRDYALSSVGSHEYWRILVVSVQSGTTSVTWASLQLVASDGTVANQFGSEAILKGVGQGGTDEIFVGIRSEYDAFYGWYNLFLNGYSGYDSNEKSWFKQPGAIPGYEVTNGLNVPMVPTWNASIPYWFVASGRSFRFALKISTTYEAGYLGLILPYASPGQYPYPLAVGGSMVPTNTTRGTNWVYSYASYQHGVYSMPGCGAVPTVDYVDCTLYLRQPDAVWAGYGNRPSSTSNPETVVGLNTGNTAPYLTTGALRAVWPHCMSDQQAVGKRPYRDCQGGGYVFQSCILAQRLPYTAVFGELEGTYSVSGFSNASENTSVVGGKTYVVFQGAYRTSVQDYWALSLD